MLGGAILDALYERPLCCEPSLLVLRMDMELPRRERGIHEVLPPSGLDATQSARSRRCWPQLDPRAAPVLSAEVCEEVIRPRRFFRSPLKSI